MNNPEGTILLSSSTVVGTDVKNLRYESVGTIKEVMLYTDTSEEAYAVLSVITGFLNMGSKYFAVPWEALSFVRAQSSGEEVITLDVDKKKLEESPGFDKDDWPLTPQSGVIAAAFKYYGVPIRSHRL